MNLGTAQVIRGDARQLPLADNSVDLVVTSPPYFALRSYQDGGEHYAGQIGSEPTPAEFVAALLEVTAECVRVLKPSGSLWVNLGDKYSQKPGQNLPRAQGGILKGTKVEQAFASRPTEGDTSGVRPKSLIGIPWRYALACIDDLGLILRAEVIWSKPNGLPESVTDRVRRSHEQWFHFTLSPRYFSAVDEIREEHKYPDDLRHLRGGRRSVNPDGTDAGGNTSTCNPLGKLPGSVWTVPTEPLRVPDHLGIDHFAAFPTEWPRRIIQGWSPAGVCVECGEGRRPVVVTSHERLDGWRPGFGASTRKDRRAPGSARPSFEGSITGYACACDPKVCRACRWNLHDDQSCSVDGLLCCPDCTHHSWETAPNSGICVFCETPSDWADGCSAGCEWPAPTTPAVVLDPFGGTGTTALVAKALGRHGITVDMSADYCRLAEWRTNDRNQLAKVLGLDKAPDPDAHQLDLFAEEQTA